MQVNYREAITQRAVFNYTHKKQSGGSGQFGKVQGYIEPLNDEDDEASKYEFENRMIGTDIPSNLIPSVDKGFQEAMSSGTLTGHPVEVRCALSF